MRNNSFKSAQHTMNWVNVQIQKKNKKQPVKVYTEEEKREFAKKLGVGVVEKPVVAPTVKEEEIDYSALPAGLLTFLNK